MNKKMNMKKTMLVIFTVILVLSSYQFTVVSIQIDPPKIIEYKNYLKNDDMNNKLDLMDDLDWPIIYDRNKEDVIREILLDSNENIVVNGFTGNNISEGMDFLTIKYDRNGEFLWDATFDGGKNDYAWDLAVDSQDNIVLYGVNYSLEADSIDDFDFTFYLIKYRFDGVELWNKTIDFEDDCYPGGIAIDSNDNIILTTGVGNFDGMSFLCYTMKMDENGNELWNTSITETMVSIGFDVVINEYDEIFIGGLEASFYGQGWFIAKYDPSGLLQWRKQYDIGNNIYDLDLDSEHNLILAGHHFSRESNSSQYLVLKCDKNGNILWKYDYDGIYNEYAQSIAINSEDQIIVLGSISSKNFFENCLLILDSQGEEQCMKKPSIDGQMLGIAVDKKDTIIASGVINNSTDSYDADGFICTFTDVTPPSIDFFTPETGYLYFTDSQLVPFFGKTVMIGKTTLGAYVSNSSDVKKVEFYVDGMVKESIDSPPYEWSWDEMNFGSYTVEIHVYDDNENIKRKVMTVWKFF